MTLATHRLALSSYVALARGEAHPDTIRGLVRARHSRDLLLVHAVSTEAAACRHPHAAVASAAFRTLAEIERVNPDAMAKVVHYPSVTAWALRTVRLLRSGKQAEARPGFLAAVAGAAAVRGGVAMTIDLTAGQRDRLLVLPSLGRVTLSRPDERVELRSRSTGSELAIGDERVPIAPDPRRSAGRWQRLSVISASCRGRRIDIALDTLDGDGDSGPEFATDEPFSPDLVRVWQARLDGAWNLLVNHHAKLAEEVSELVAVFAPLAAPAVGEISATPDDAFGCIALTRPHDSTNLALTLAHEIQHVKLTAVSDLFQLVEHDQSERFYTPWRDDPRPAFGVLHGVYAYLGVIAFWKRQMSHLSGADVLHAQTEFARWLSATREVVDMMIARARMTPNGRIFLGGVKMTLDNWRDEPVEPAALAAAERLKQAHRAAWVAAHGGFAE